VYFEAAVGWPIPAARVSPRRDAAAPHHLAFAFSLSCEPVCAASPLVIRARPFAVSAPKPAYSLDDASMPRLGHKKSRNGCLQCKARHVKVGRFPLHNPTLLNVFGLGVLTTGSAMNRGPARTAQDMGCNVVSSRVPTLMSHHRLFLLSGSLIRHRALPV
jgi:hypothetical protein